MQSEPRPTATLLHPAAVGPVGFGAVLATFAALHFSVFRSDVAWYWRDSLDWLHPFDKVHVPGWPLLIALARGVTLSTLSPTVLMTVLAAILFAVSGYGTYRAVSALADREAGLVAAVLILLWPCVGASYSAYPIADRAAITLVVVAAWAAAKDRPVAAGLFLGLAAVTHKGLWYLVAALTLTIAFEHREHIRRAALVVTMAALPLAVLWVAGAMHYHQTGWILSATIDTDASFQRSLPVLDGVIGGALHGGTTGALKSALLFGILVAAVFLTVAGWRQRSSLVGRLSMAVAAPLALLAVTVSQNTAWAGVRFSPILALPVGWLFGERLSRVRVDLRAASVFVLLATQVAFAAYIVHYFT